MISRTVLLVLLNIALTLTGISYVEAAAVRQGDLLTDGFTPILTTGGGNVNEDGGVTFTGLIPGGDDNSNNGGVLVTEPLPTPSPSSSPSSSPSPSPSPKPAVTVRTLTSNIRTAFTSISRNNVSSELGNYVVNSVKFRQAGNNGPLEITDYRVTVLGGEPFAERVWDESNSSLTTFARTNTFTFFVYVREPPCSFELAVTGRAVRSGSQGTETPPLSEWTSLNTLITTHKTWCEGGIFFQRTAVRGVDLQVV